MEKKYSGGCDHSEEFWKQVASLKNKTVRDLVYIAGRALQEHETRVLQMLDEAKKSEF